MNDALHWSDSEQAALAGRHRTANTAAQQRTSRQRLRLLLLRAIAPLARAPAPAGDAPPARILVIRPDHLGDLLFATPALHRLRTAWPCAHISALVGPWGQAILQDNPDLNRILTLPFPGFTRQPPANLWAPYRLLLAEAVRLRQERFDLALILRFDHWWGAWLAQRAAIPHRLGFAIPECAPFLTTAIPHVAARHEVEQNLALVNAAVSNGDNAPAGPLRFVVPAAAQAWAEAWLSDHDLAGRRLAALLPGAGAPVKRWRNEAWAELIVALRARGLTPILAGGPDEAPLAQAIQASLSQSAPSLVGAVSLAQLAAIFQRCVHVIGLDSGPMHLAVAQGASTVHLYGPVDTARFGPWDDPAWHRVVVSAWACQPCNRLDFSESDLPLHPCVRAISVEQVLSAVDGGGSRK